MWETEISRSILTTGYLNVLDCALQNWRERVLFGTRLVNEGDPNQFREPFVGRLDWVTGKGDHASHGNLGQVTLSF